MVSGKITQVIGPVVDVGFPSGQLPRILNALRVSNPSISNCSSHSARPYFARTGSGSAQ